MDRPAAIYMYMYIGYRDMSLSIIQPRLCLDKVHIVPEYAQAVRTGLPPT